MTGKNFRTQFATLEAKELLRIRNSRSFRIVVALGKTIKNPLKIISLPLALPKLLFSRKIEAKLKPSPNSIVIVGMDTQDVIWSERATKLAIELQRFDSNLQISLLTTGDEIIKDRAGKLLNFRIPRPRSVDSSRKDWNLTSERLLSMVFHLQEASRLVYLGDYLYSGIRRSVNSYHSDLQLHWINSGGNNIGLEQISVKKSTSTFKDSLLNLKEKVEISESTIQSHLNLPLDRIILAHLQVTPSGLDIWGKHLRDSIKKTYFGNKVITSSNNQFGLLPETVELPSHVEPFTTPGFQFRIIDDQPESINRIHNDEIPSLILRTGRSLDKVSMKQLEELERNCEAIVLRRPQLATLIDAIETLCDNRSRMCMITKRKRSGSNIVNEISWAASMHSLVFGIDN